MHLTQINLLLLIDFRQKIGNGDNTAGPVNAAISSMQLQLRK